MAGSPKSAFLFPDESSFEMPFERVQTVRETAQFGPHLIDALEQCDPAMVLYRRRANVDLGEYRCELANPLADSVLGACLVLALLSLLIDVLSDGIVLHALPAVHPWHSIGFNGIGQETLFMR